MSTPEFSRVVDLRQCDGREIELVTTSQERAALSERFGLVRVDKLEARLALTREGDELRARGTRDAEWVQSCAVSAEDLPVPASEPLTLRFVPASKGDLPDDVFESGDAVPELRLITCGGTFDKSSGHYLDNFVIFARESD